MEPKIGTWCKKHDQWSATGECFWCVDALVDPLRGNNPNPAPPEKVAGWVCTTQGCHKRAVLGCADCSNAQCETHRKVPMNHPACLARVR